jgi:hypothetical protein
VSLTELSGKTSYFRGEKRIRKEKPTPDFKGLRELLSEVTVGQGEDKKAERKEEKPAESTSSKVNEADNEAVLKPGDKINF